MKLVYKNILLKHKKTKRNEKFFFEIFQHDRDTPPFNAYDWNTAQQLQNDKNKKWKIITSYCKISKKKKKNNNNKNKNKNTLRNVT